MQAAKPPLVDISIVIPVYNSEDCLEECTAQISQHLSGHKYEIILVDDQSLDESWQKITSLSKLHENIHGLSLRKNSGQDSAIMAGLRVAQNELIIIMDDDLQHNPSDILGLVDHCLEFDLDVCYANFIRKKQATWKNLGSWLNMKLLEILLKKKKGIYTSPFKVIRKDLVNEIIKYEGAYPYLDAIIISLTDNYSQIDTTHHLRFAGKSNYNLYRSVAVFLKMFFSFSSLPLRIAFIMGLIMSCLSFIIGIIFIIFYFLDKESIVSGWTSLVVLLTFLGGIQLLFLGIIGEYVGRTYVKVNHNAQYTISSRTDQI